MRFELFVALRYLRAKRRQTMVSVISAISVLGITAGVMALVIALALSTGFREDIQTKIVGATSHINLLRLDNTSISDYQHLLSRVERVPGIIGIAPSIFNQVFISSDFRSQGAVLKGVDPVRERQVSDFFAHIVEGDSHALEGPRPIPEPDAPLPPENIIVGREMARTLSVKLGDTLRVLVPHGKLTPSGMTVPHKRFKVAAMVDSALWDSDA